MRTHYTRESILSDVQDPKVDKFSGCMVYYGGTPEEVLEHANSHDYEYWGTFLGVTDGMFDVQEDNSGWECIIPCQSQEFEGDYIPFQYQVLEIDTFSIKVSKHDPIVTWHDLWKHFEFLDGSPCGRLYGEDNR